MESARFAYPQVGLPDGPVALALDPAQLMPHLDRVLQEIIGPPVPATVEPVTVPVTLPKKPRRRRKPRPVNPDHHLWNNHGTWFISYTIHPDALTKERIRHSLKTRCLATALHRRDLILARQKAKGLLAEARTARILGGQTDMVNNHQSARLCDGDNRPD